MSESAQDMSTDEAADALGVARYEVTDVRAHAGWVEALHHDMASHEEAWRKVARVTTPEHVDAMAARATEDADPDTDGSDTDGDGVPDGSTRQVLEWVGDDTERARLALAAERNGKRRTTLLPELEKLAGVE